MEIHLDLFNPKKEQTNKKLKTCVTTYDCCKARPIIIVQILYFLLIA